MKRTRSAFIFIFLALISSPLTAQDKVDLFGYFEPQFMGVSLQNQFYQLFSNKLRVDLKWGPLDNITFAANFDFITYHGKTEWNILDFLPSQITDVVPEDLRSIYVIPFSNRPFLDNAYLKLAFKHFDITVGKQQISLGTGNVWNPTDIINIKDPIDPTYEQPGQNALRLDVPLGDSTTFSTLYSPDDEWESSAKMVQLKSRISRFDFTLVAIEKTWLFHDYTQFDFGLMNFPELPEKRQLLGFSTAGEILGIGIWAEFAYNWMENTDDFYELVTGFDYTFDFQTYVLVEYFRNSLGRTDKADYSLNDWMRLMVSEQKAIAKDQLYALAQHPVTDLMSLGLSTIYNITDGSFVLVPTLEYSLSDNVDIFAYLNLNVGKEGTQYDKSLGRGGMIRARIYF
ncbi:MAG: hypothetical protein MUP98_00690 [Candidatus Aminicenantes bacterium]|nr:hypothetical protein [Candidatus Aminicenantes bacterium]